MGVGGVFQAKGNTCTYNCTVEKGGLAMFRKQCPSIEFKRECYSVKPKRDKYKSRCENVKTFGDLAIFIVKLKGQHRF